MQINRVCMLPNGKPITIQSAKDLGEVIRCFCGDDVYDVFEDICLNFDSYASQELINEMQRDIKILWQEKQENEKKISRMKSLFLWIFETINTFLSFNKGEEIISKELLYAIKKTAEKNTL